MAANIKITKVEIDNQSKQELKAIYEYLAGYETRLRDKIDVTINQGNVTGKDYITIKDKTNGK